MNTIIARRILYIRLKMHMSLLRRPGSLNIVLMIIQLSVSALFPTPFSGSPNSGSTAFL